MTSDPPDLPDFLNRKLNGLAPDAPPSTSKGRQRAALIWTKKRNWRKIEARRREQEKKEGAALIAGTIVKRRGQ